MLNNTELFCKQCKNGLLEIKVQHIKSKLFNIKAEQDIISVRRIVRELANEIGLKALNQTKLVTAASEITRNIIKYADNGTLEINVVKENDRTGLQMIFNDYGPGIPDVSLAMIAGYTTGGGLGVGLSGTKQLVDEFDIKSEVGKGTSIKLILWK
jgi:serine/threonine-protein kinase RsbT